MATTRKARVPMTAPVSAFYNWASRCRKAAAVQIPAPNYGHCEIPHSKQDVVPIDIASDHLPEQHMASQMHQTNLDNYYICRRLDEQSAQKQRNPRG